jgi:hypothetical protein
MRATVNLIYCTYPAMNVGLRAHAFASRLHYLSPLTLTQFPLREPELDLLFRISTSNAQARTDPP